jgi:hypothetical protein
MNRWYSSGSSNALGFGYSTAWSQTASAPDELAVEAAVHPTPAFKSYKHLCLNHTTRIASAPDEPMPYRIISGSSDACV